MAVTINKKFWNGTSYSDLSKIVFTSPNITSPSAAGTRSHILPGGSYVGTWYEASDFMYRYAIDQRAPASQLTSGTKQTTFFNELTLKASYDFNIGSTAQVSLKRNDLIASGERVIYNSNNYATISGLSSYVITTSGISISVLAPTSSSTWTYGDNKEEYIWWKSSGISRYENVGIYISYDNGTSWTLNQTTINDGSTTIVPTQSSATAKIKVVFNDTYAISDAFVINSYFSYKPTVNTTVDKIILNQPYISTSDIFVKVSGYTWSDGTYIYKMLHNTYCTCYKYSIAANMWFPTGWSNSPYLFNDKGSFLMIDTDVYIISGIGNYFWKYDTINNSWSVLNPPSTLGSTYWDSTKWSYISTLGESGVIYTMNNVNNVGTTYSSYLLKYTIAIDYWEVFKTFTNSVGTHTGPFFIKTGGIYYVSHYSSTFAYFKSTSGNTNSISSTSITDATGPILGTTSSGYLSCCFSNGQFVLAPSTISGALGRTFSSYTSSAMSATTDNTYFYFNTLNSGITTDYQYRMNPTYSGTGEFNYLPGSDIVLYNQTTPAPIIYINDNIYTTQSLKSNSICKTTLSGVWSYLTSSAIGTTYDGTDLYFTHKLMPYINTDNTNLYYVKGKETNKFYKYNMTTWSGMANLPFTAKEYFCMDYITSSGCFCAIQGKGSTGFWRYNSNNTWDVLTSLPSLLDDKCAIKTLESSIYVLKGNVTGKLYKYINSGNYWETKTDYPGDITKIVWGMTGSGTLINIFEANTQTYVYSYDTSSDTWLMDNVVGLDSKKLLSVTDEPTGRYVYALADISSTGNNYNFNDTVKIYKVDMTNYTIVSGTSNYIPESSIPGSWEAPAATTTGTIMYNTTLTLSGVIGTSVLPTDSKLYCWPSTLSGTVSSGTYTTNSCFVSPRNSVMFEVTQGEAYGCYLTAWDDDTHTTVNNKILSEEHYKATCVAYRAGSGTKQSPLSSKISNSLVYPPGQDITLKGNEHYYGTFDLRYAANGGITGTEIGEYLLFMPRLDDINGTFTNGNYDFVTTLHYQYT